MNKRKNKIMGVVHQTLAFLSAVLEQSPGIECIYCMTNGEARIRLILLTPLYSSTGRPETNLPALLCVANDLCR
jgi:hypothetical protein